MKDHGTAARRQRKGSGKAVERSREDSGTVGRRQAAKGGDNEKGSDGKIAPPHASSAACTRAHSAAGSSASERKLRYLMLSTVTTI